MFTNCWSRFQHSYIANGLGGRNGALVVDLRKLKAITVNSKNGTALIQTGNRLGDIALALNEKGRAMPHGTCPYVGIGGHAGYGGFGFVSRLWGLTLDNTVSATVVLANGTIAKASSTVNSDLFWAIRGSAGSFGIVTSIEFKTFPVPPSVTVFIYQWTLDVSMATSALSSFQNFVGSGIPAEFGAEIDVFKGSSTGTVKLELVGGYYGPPGQFQGVIAPYLATMPTPASTSVTPGTYIASVKAFAGGDGNLNSSVAPDTHDTFYAKSIMTPESSPMTTEAIQAFFTYVVNQATTTNWFVQFELYGGSNSMINSVALDATAFAHRSSLFTVQFYASSPTGNPPYPSEGFSFLDNMVSSIVTKSPANWDYGAYPNYIDDELPDWQELYYGSHYARLESIKASVDPNDLFNFQTSIQE